MTVYYKILYFKKKVTRVSRVRFTFFFNFSDSLRNYGVKSHLIGGGLRSSDSAEIEISLRFRSFRLLTNDSDNKVYLDNEKKQPSHRNSKGGSLIIALLSTTDTNYQNSRLTIRLENSSVSL